MVVDHVAAGDTAFLTFGRVGQGPDAGVGEGDVLGGESCPGDQAVRFVYEVIYLLVVSDDSVEVSSWRISVVPIR